MAATQHASRRPAVDDGDPSAGRRHFPRRVPRARLGARDGGSRPRLRVARPRRRPRPGFRHHRREPRRLAHRAGVHPGASPRVAPEAGEERSLGPAFRDGLPRRRRSARPRRARRSLRLLDPARPPPPPLQALRKNPEVGRLLDVGTVVREEEDSRDLFERVFQRLDRDADRVVTRREFREYFLPEPAAPPANRSAAAAALTTPPRSPAPSAPTSRPSTRGGGGGGGGDHDAARRPPLRRRSRRSTRSGLPPRPAPGAASP